MKTDHTQSTKTTIAAMPALSPIFVSGNTTFMEMAPTDDMLVRDYARRMTCELAEMLLGEIMEIETAALCGAERYQRGATRHDRRIACYRRKLQTSAGVIGTRVPVLQKQVYVQTVTENYMKHEATVNAQLADMYLRGASSSRLKQIVSLLWGDRKMPADIAELGTALAWKIEMLRNSPIDDAQPGGKLSVEYVTISGNITDSGKKSEKVLAAFLTEGIPQRRSVIAVVTGEPGGVETWKQFCRLLAVRGVSQALALTPISENA